MYIINTTYSIDEEIVEEWLTWFKSLFGPTMAQSGSVDGYELMRIVSMKEEGTESYSCQLRFNSVQDLQKYVTINQSAHNEMVKQKYDTKVLFFSTVLQIV